MPFTPSEELRVARLEQTSTAVHEILAKVQDDQRRQFGQVRQILKHHSERLDAHDQRFDGIDATLAEVLQRLPEPS